MKRITRKIALLFLVLLSLIFAVTSEAADTKTMTITLTIKKETPTSSDFTFTPPSNLSYNDQPKTATITSKVDGMGVITVEYYDSTGTKLDSAPIYAGTYTVKANVAEGTKYKAAVISDDSWKFTIINSQYTLTFDTDGGTEIAAITQNYSTDITAPSDPTRTGYTFAGWDKEIPAKMPAENMTFKASWTANIYTITYTLNGGTMSTANPEGYTIESESITLNNPTKNGYDFIGWSYGDNLSNNFTIPTGSTNNLTLTAKWKAKIYTISYDLDGGIVSVDNPASYTIESDDIKLINPTKVSFEFTGWSFDNTLSLDVTILKGSTGNRKFIATWDAVSIPEQEPEQDEAPRLSITDSNITLRRGITITGIKVTAISGNNLTWSSSGELPEGLTYATTSRDFIISGTVASSAETRAYDYTVTAANTAGTDSKEIIITLSASSAASETTIETTAEDIAAMTTEELNNTFKDKSDIILRGNVENLSQVLETLAAVTTVKTLDLSFTEGLEEVKLDDSFEIETLTIVGNTSIKTVEVTGSTAIKTLDITGSKVETLNAKGCESLESVNIEGCDSLITLDVSETPITSLNAQDCNRLETLNCSSCDIYDLKLDGCENLVSIDCSNNSLTRFNAGVFSKINSLECKNQHVYGWPRARTLNIIDILLRKFLNISAADDNDDYSDAANVKDVEAYDEDGNNVLESFDDETGILKFTQPPYELKYNYVTGFDGTPLMDVTVSTVDGENVADNKLDSAGGGCDTGLSDVTLFAGLLMIFRKR